MKDMITPQDIREAQLEKAVLGGYVMDAVDELLEECAVGLEELQAKHQEEVRVLKNKMKILADTVTESRKNEDAVAGALLSAQKMASEVRLEAEVQSETMLRESQIKSESLLRESQARSEAMIRESQRASDELLSKARLEVKTEEAKLVEAKRRTAEFIENMRKIFDDQLTFFDTIGTLQLSLAASGAIETSYLASAEPLIPVQIAEPEVVIEIEAPDEIAPIEDAEEDAETDAELDVDSTRPYRLRELAPDEATPRPKYKFDEIDTQFGDNYDSKK